MLHHLDDPVVLPPLTSDERTAIQQRGTRMRRRRHALQIGIPATLAAAAVAVAALAGVTNPNAGPEPITRTSCAPTSTGLPVTTVPPPGPYDAVSLRGTTLVAIDAHGHECDVRDLSGAPLGLSPAEFEFARISAAGWLSLERGRPSGHNGPSVDITFINLLDPQAARAVVNGHFDIRTWSPDGVHLAVTGADAHVTVIDAATAAKSTVDIQGGGVPGGGPRVVWTEDGTGVVVWRPDGKGLEVVPIDGGPVRDHVPALWFDGGARYLNPEGMQISGAHLIGHGTTSSPWAAGLNDATVIDSTFTRDGRSAFMLLTSADGKSLLVARTSPGSPPTVLATMPKDTTFSGAYIEPAPDDSMVLVRTVGVDHVMRNYVVPLDSSPARLAPGNIPSWVPADVVDAIARTR